VPAAGGDRGRRTPDAEIHGRVRARRLVNAHHALIAIAELAVEREAPAAHAAVVEHRTGVGVAGRERRDRAPCPDVHGSDRAGGLVVADGVSVRVADLAVAAEAPAAHVTTASGRQAGVVEHRAGVVHAGRELSRERRGGLRRLSRPCSLGTHDRDRGQRNQRAENGQPPARNTDDAVRARCCRGRHG